MADRPLRFVIVGAGMSGILAGIKLQEAGFVDYTIYEKAERLGGTWRENTYPGIACDVPSHLYSYSFEPNAEWSHRFSPGAEIQAYFEGVAQRHGVARRIRFGEEVTRCAFEAGRWRLDTKSGGRDEADVVIAATGVLHHPNVPELPGRDSFEGALFHSARWDHAVKLDGRRVGIVGTGSTAVQIVSALVDRVGKLVLFQRTAQWIMPQDNPPYSDAEKDGFRHQPQTMRQLHEQLSLLFAQGFSNAVVDASSPQMKAIEDACRANLENNVADPVLREKLRPSYRAACKRLIISPDFYRAIQQPNAELETAGIERIEPRGVCTREGRLHELDVLVLATGFRADRFVRPIGVLGENGAALDARWAKRPDAYLSIAVPGFPNFFMLNGPNGPVGNFSLIEVAELQMAYVLQLVERLRAGSCRTLAPREDATAAFEAAREEAAKRTVWTTGCRSWYLDDRGIPAVWPWTFDRFREEMARPKLEHWAERPEERQRGRRHRLGLLLVHQQPRPRHGDEAAAVAQLRGHRAGARDREGGVVLAPDEEHRRLDLGVALRESVDELPVDAGEVVLRSLEPPLRGDQRLDGAGEEVRVFDTAAVEEAAAEAERGAAQPRRTQQQAHRSRAARQPDAALEERDEGRAVAGDLRVQEHEPPYAAVGQRELASERRARVEGEHGVGGQGERVGEAPQRLGLVGEAEARVLAPERLAETRRVGQQAGEALREERQHAAEAPARERPAVDQQQRLPAPYAPPSDPCRADVGEVRRLLPELVHGRAPRTASSERPSCSHSVARSNR
jgi:cation diffusion facilitator CzcD-associated flavoprotein CzcO